MIFKPGQYKSFSALMPDRDIIQHVGDQVDHKGNRFLGVLDREESYFDDGQVSARNPESELSYLTCDADIRRGDTVFVCDREFMARSDAVDRMDGWSYVSLKYCGCSK